MRLVLKDNYDIEVDGFTFTNTGISITGTPSFIQWEQVGEFLKKTNKCVQFWIGDWLNYGETRWGEKYAQALEGLDYTIGGLKNMAYVASKIEKSRRRDDIQYSVYQEVASLSPKDQDSILDKAHGKTVREVRNEVRLLKGDEVISHRKVCPNCGYEF